MRKLIAIVIVLCLFAAPAYARSAKAAAAGGGKATVQKATPGERIANETAEAVADVLTGKDSSKKEGSGSLPPGLAKKDKTPPGWDKGKKEGWDKEGHKDSPIEVIVKSIFGKTEKK